MGSSQKNMLPVRWEHIRSRLATGWARWIRTTGMTESKSVALPLGYSPIIKNIFPEQNPAGKVLQFSQNSADTPLPIRTNQLYHIVIKNTSLFEKKAKNIFEVFADLTILSAFC